QEYDPVDLDDENMPLGIGVKKKLLRIPLEEEEKNPRGMRIGVRGGGLMTTGIIKEEEVLVDPMTNEEMSKTWDLYTAEDVANNPSLSSRDIAKQKMNEITNKPLVIIRDHWFRIQAKFKWKDAPEIEEEVPTAPDYQNI
ncbi:MAG: hypothetical protein KAS23_03640, partial [Anaerohalosphaera sp.]|nr:hypothetical protein [Anaerohalosphaera sp.]